MVLAMQDACWNERKKFIKIGMESQSNTFKIFGQISEEVTILQWRPLVLLF